MKEKGLRFEITDKKYRGLLFLSYGAVAAVVIAVMTVAIVTWFRSYVRGVMSDMAQTQLENLDNIVEYDLETYREQLLIAFQNSDVKKYIYSKRTDPMEKYRVSLFLADMCVINGVADYVCVFRGEEDFDYYGSRWPEEEEQAQIQSGIYESTNDGDYFTVKSGNRTLLCLYATDRDSLGGKPQCGLIYGIDVKKLERQLISWQNKGAMFFIFTKQGDRLLGTSYSDDTVVEVWDRIDGQEVEFDSGEVTVDRTRYLASSQYDAKNALYIVMVQDYEKSLKDTAAMSKVIYLAIFLSFLIVLAIAVALTQLLYGPLERFLISLRNNVDASAGEEEYSRRMTQISTEKILSQINIMSKHYHSNQVLEYLGDADGQEEIPDLLRLMDRGEACVMLLYWTDAVVWPGKLSTRISKELEKRISDCRIHAFGDLRNPWFLIIAKGFRDRGQARSSSELETLAIDICQKIGRDSAVALYCAMSDYLTEESELKESFAQLMDCVKYLLLGKCDSLTTQRSLQEKRTEEISKKNYEEILNDIKNGREAEASGKIPQLLDSLQGWEIHVALLFLAETCVQIRRSASEIAESNVRKIQESFLDNYLKITSMHGREELEEYLKTCIQEACFEHNVLPEKSLRMNMLDAVRYIQEHYCDKDISVDSIAEKFHISASYFSKLFNEYVGMTFPEYINDLRLSHAKELLQFHPEYSVKKITDLCGFGNASYFSAQFKKKFGVSPSSYKL